MGRVDVQSLYPRKTGIDVLVFELPVERAGTLKLELPASNIGGTGMLRLSVPVAMIERR